jgi:L,D-transpeptidase catalytic domain/Putative peptidoglycan binding domain
MKQSVRRWLAGAGAMTAVGAAVLSQAGLSGTAMAATASRAAPAHAAAGQRALGRAQARSAAQGKAVSPAGWAPTKHIIYYGEDGGVVTRLQLRLRRLHYYPGKADGKFGQDTLEAVWAFKEVQGLSLKHHPNNVGFGMQRKLVHPRLPKVLNPHGGSNKRIEVNQNIQVLVLYHHNKVELISHVSTGGRYYFCEPNGGGCGHFAVTPDGRYRAHIFVPGWMKVPLGTMYNPVFFIGEEYAIHGDIPVPLYPASHGCVRIPMDIAGWFHKLVWVDPHSGKGTPIFIHGKAPAA